MIHYHGTPVGGKVEDAARFLKGRHGLVSYANQSDLPILADVCQSFVLDNGAFTEWKRSGSSIDIDGYYDWVRTWSRHPAFDWCLVPDVIDGSEEDNHIMRVKWSEITLNNSSVRAMPVYHFHEPLELLDNLIRQVEYGVYFGVALGSSGEYPNPNTDKWWRRISEIMEVACQEGIPRCKLHGLRMLNVDIFTRLPLSSADSCNAVINSGSIKRFGMYKPPTTSQRAEVIAARIESHQSAAVWIDSKQEDLF